MVEIFVVGTPTNQDCWIFKWGAREQGAEENIWT